jgi:intracellular sulfur oxidation DsrE/DsrF family protein
MNMSKMVSAVSVAAVMFGLTSMAHADSTSSNVVCPVGLVSGMTLDEEFGPAVADNTRCVQKRHDVKTMFAVNAYVTDPAHPDTSGPYALNQIQNVYNDYTITAGMTPGLDFSLIVVVHGPGGRLLLSDPTQNRFIAQVQHLMDEGVTFYFCENTVRGFMKAGLLEQGNVAAGVIPGVKFVTAGLAAMSDFESAGYNYVQP